MPLILLLYSDSPCTASTRPLIFKQIDKYWFLTPPAKDSLVSSQRTHVCGMSSASWLKSVSAGSFLLLKRQAQRGSWIPAKSNPPSAGRSQSFLNPLSLLRHRLVCGQKGLWELDLSERYLGLKWLSCREFRTLFSMLWKINKSLTWKPWRDLAPFCSLRATLPQPWSSKLTDYSSSHLSTGDMSQAPQWMPGPAFQILQNSLLVMLLPLHAYLW